MVTMVTMVTDSELNSYHMEQWHCFVSNHLTAALPALGADMPVLASLEEAPWEFVVWEKAVLWRSK